MHAYDAAAWQLNRPRHDLNFHDITSSAQEEMLAPPPRLVTNEERHHRLAMAAWHENFPQDGVDERELFHVAAGREQGREASTQGVHPGAVGRPEHHSGERSPVGRSIFVYRVKFVGIRLPQWVDI
jgi:hypothetical protein